MDLEDEDARFGLEEEPVAELDFSAPSRSLWDDLADAAGRGYQAEADMVDQLEQRGLTDVEASTFIRVGRELLAAEDKREQRATDLAAYPATPEMRIALHNSRDARRGGRPRGTLTVVQWIAIRAAWGERCAYCTGKPKSLTIEHVRPICLGGKTEFGNIVPSCGRCNKRKGTLDAREWLGDRYAAFKVRLDAANAAAGGLPGIEKPQPD